MEYISLGGNCSVAYNLQNNNKRNCSYPFDWIRIPFSSVVKCLSNNFSNFLLLENLKIINKSSKFPYLETDKFIKKNNNNLIVKNELYNCVFYHDFLDKFSIEEQHNTFFDKYNKRISRLYDSIKNKNKIIFIRDQLKINQIDDIILKEFIEIIKKINPLLNFKIILIVHNPKNKIINIQENKFIKIINDNLPFNDWIRPNVNWDYILDLKKKNNKIKRQKILFNPNIQKDFSELFLDKYLLHITDYINLMDKKYLQSIDNINLQLSSNHNLGIKIIFLQTKFLNDIYNYFLKKYTFNVFSYEYKNKTVFLSNNKSLEESFTERIIYYRSLESFSQINHKLSCKLHDTIFSLISKNDILLTIGGECGYYSMILNKYFKKIFCITNSQYIYNDCVFNNSNDNTINKLIDYNKINLLDLTSIANTIIINIGKKGLKENICKQILEITCNQIFYIGCCKKYIIQDLIILQKKYKINNVFHFNFFNNYEYVYLIELVR